MAGVDARRAAAASVDVAGVERAFHRRRASGGRSSGAAEIASAGATGTGVRKDPPAPAVVRPCAAWGSIVTLARRPPVLRSLWRVPPTWAYCVESGPK